MFHHDISVSWQCQAKQGFENLLFVLTIAYQLHQYNGACIILNNSYCYSHGSSVRWFVGHFFPELDNTYLKNVFQNVQQVQELCSGCDSSKHGIKSHINQRKIKSQSN